MSRSRTPLPIDADGNGTRLATFIYDLADAPMLIHALAIGANTVMMCGGGQAQHRMRWYRDQIAATAPPGWQHLPREEDLANIAIAMATAQRWSIHRKMRWTSDKTAPTIITVGDHEWTTFRLTAAEHDELAACIAAIAPITCEHVARDNDVARSW